MSHAGGKNSGRRIAVKPSLVPMLARGRQSRDFAHVTVTATATHLTLKIDCATGAENIMIWVNGALVVEKHNFSSQPPYLGHSWVYHDPGQLRQTVTIERSLIPFPLNGGLARVTVSVWPLTGIQPDDGVYLDRYVWIPGTVYTPVMPTVLSGRAIFGSRLFRTFFHCDANTMQQDLLKDTFLEAGVSHITISVFNNPADNPGWTTFELWKASWDQLVKTQVDWCETNGFRIIGTGDGWFRTQAERDWTNTSPFAQQATEYCVSYLAAHGCDGIEMVDEVGSDPADYGDPETFVSWVRGVNGPPLSWPNQHPVNWEVPELSDYSSRFPASQTWRHGRKPPLSSTIWGYAKACGVACEDAPLARPLVCLVGSTGPFYQKLVPGPDYTDQDTTLNGGMHPLDVIGQTWLMIAHGASGLRYYGYDWALWRDDRLNWPAGQVHPGGLQTGTRPVDFRWPGFAAACQSVAAREAQMLGAAYEPVENGPWVSGRRGSVWWSVNTSEDTLSAGRLGTVVSTLGEAAGTMVPPGGVIIFNVE